MGWSLEQLRAKFAKYEKWSSVRHEEELFVAFCPPGRDCDAPPGDGAPPAKPKSLAARMVESLRRSMRLPAGGNSPSSKNDAAQDWKLCKVVIDGDTMFVAHELTPCVVCGACRDAATMQWRNFDCVCLLQCMSHWYVECLFLSLSPPSLPLSLPPSLSASLRC